MASLSSVIDEDITCIRTKVSEIENLCKQFKDFARLSDAVTIYKLLRNNDNVVLDASFKDDKFYGLDDINERIYIKPGSESGFQITMIDCEDFITKDLFNQIRFIPTKLKRVRINIRVEYVFTQSLTEKSALSTSMFILSDYTEKQISDSLNELQIDMSNIWNRIKIFSYTCNLYLDIELVK